jgi:uncharacterized protein (DUF924 family)
MPTLTLPRRPGASRSGSATIPKSTRKSKDVSAWPASARATLARIIVLDQFTRNLYRNTARAFAFDDKALELSLELQREGGLGALGWIGRVFVLMPMQHAEDLEVQERSVRLFEELARRCLTAHREMLEDNAKYARLHRDIVARFGRFPHRNKTLGRASTTAELEWLASGAPTFGPGG